MNHWRRKNKKGELPSEMLLEFVICLLEELQEYRQIGTIDECREAREKQMPKEPGIGADKN